MKKDKKNKKNKRSMVSLALKDTKNSRSRRPIRGEVAVAQVMDKYSEYPSNGLTPVRLAEIFKEADAGDVLRQSELYEEIEEKDPHLFSQMQTRKNAVTGLDYEVLPFGDEERDKQIAEYITDQLASIENFEDVEMDLLDAIGKGFAVSEIIWGQDLQGRTIIEAIKSRHQKRFFWDSLDDSFRVRTAEHPEGILIPENKFIVHTYKARSGHPARAGVIRVIAWMYLFKNYTMKDWVSFAEIYGLPLRLGKYQQGASEDDKRALMQALVQIGADAAGIIPDGTTIDFVTTEKTSSVDLYERLARYCDEQISKAVLGQTLTSDSGGGSYAQSKTHNDVRHDLTMADCKALAATLRRDLLRPLCLYNFGETVRIPYIRFACEEGENLAQTATIIGTLIRETGLKIPTSYLYKKFSIPKPEDGEEVANPQSQTGSVVTPWSMKDRKMALKEEENPGSKGLGRTEGLMEAAMDVGPETFRDLYRPIQDLLEDAESLEEIKAALDDPKQVRELYGRMESPELERMLSHMMTLADVEGRRVDE